MKFLIIRLPKCYRLVSTYNCFLIAGICTIGIIALVIAVNISDVGIATQQYDIYVDPLLDKQNLFITGRVTIQNTGSESLTNVRVNFGQGDTLDIGTMGPGKRIIVSPPENNAMDYVIVTADNDIIVSKAYRTPPKMVGMMGS